VRAKRPTPTKIELDAQSVEDAAAHLRVSGCTSVLTIWMMHRELMGLGQVIAKLNHNRRQGVQPAPTHVLIRRPMCSGRTELKWSGRMVGRSDAMVAEN
jgi:hypothetical protein